MRSDVAGGAVCAFCFLGWRAGGGVIPSCLTAGSFRLGLPPREIIDGPLFRAPDRRQRFLLPIDMMDWLPEDDIVHLIVDAVGVMDLQRV